MFCTSCGASNPEDARFCNQCGVARADAPASAPSTLSGPAAARQASAQGAPTRSQQGTASLDRVELPMKGPSRGSFAVVGAITGVLGIALGATVAYRSGTSQPETIPVTPVGLIGEPAAVVAVREVDAGAASTTARGTRAPRPAARSPNAPGAEPARAPSGTAQQPGASPPSGATEPERPARPANGTSPEPSPAPEAPRAPSPGAAAQGGGTDASGATARLPDEPSGVIERGPRVSSGGYTLGEETDATGTMDGRVFSYVYNHYKSQISACYSSASRARTVSGVIVLRVRIGTDGRVVRTRVISDSARVPELATCVQNAVRAWRYPQPEGGEVEVDYPMRFGSSS